MEIDNRDSEDLNEEKRDIKEVILRFLGSKAELDRVKEERPGLYQVALKELIPWKELEKE